MARTVIEYPGTESSSTRPLAISAKRAFHPNPFVSLITIRNYKSVGKASLSLGKLTLLVGRNGSGKSNFLDALRFVTDCLRSSIEHALNERGSINEVRRRSTGHPRNLAIELHLNLPMKGVAIYGFEIAARKGGGFEVKREQLICRTSGREPAWFIRERRRVRTSVEASPPVAEDRLYLANIAGYPQFRMVYDGLISMGFYNLNPDEMKDLQSPDAGELLHRDGANIASVVGRLSGHQPRAMRRITTYLSSIVPGISGVTRASLGPKETLLFRQDIEGARSPWKFYASSMSDGTLRALGALVAVVQIAGAKGRVRLVGLEEPETALHPAAAAALMDALREASVDTQVLVTTHSPDLLDQVDPSRESLLVVASELGTTRIAPVDTGSLAAIQKHLYSPGELLRMDQLKPNEKDLKRQEQQSLFPEIPDS